MKTLIATLLALAAVSAAADTTVVVFKDTISIQYDSRRLEIDGEPTPAQRQALRDGTIRVLQFTSPRAIYAEACQTLTDCAEAVDWTARTLSERGWEARGERGRRGGLVACVGKFAATGSGVLVACP